MAGKADAKLNLARRFCQFGVSKRCYSPGSYLHPFGAKTCLPIARIGATDPMPMLQTSEIACLHDTCRRYFHPQRLRGSARQAAPVSAPFPTQVSVPATVQGFMPGYSDKGLTHIGTYTFMNVI